MKLPGVRMANRANSTGKIGALGKEEAKHWQPEKKPVTSRFRTALRIDNYLKGDWQSISAALRKEGLEESLEGAKGYLRKWADIYKPEYMMASTPHDWRYPDPPAAASMKPLHVVPALLLFCSRDSVLGTLSGAMETSTRPLQGEGEVWNTEGDSIDASKSYEVAIAAVLIACVWVINCHVFVKSWGGWFHLQKQCRSFAERCANFGWIKQLWRHDKRRAELHARQMRRVRAGTRKLRGK
eukprot:Skav228675  [mRNA]  locus=scaffold3331:3514:6876:+ [translate_table: standard]